LTFGHFATSDKSAHFIYSKSSFAPAAKISPLSPDSCRSSPQDQPALSGQYRDNQLFTQRRNDATRTLKPENRFLV
jgi:hypothetical protein